MIKKIIQDISMFGIIFSIMYMESEPLYGFIYLCFETCHHFFNKSNIHFYIFAQIYYWLYGSYFIYHDRTSESLWNVYMCVLVTIHNIIFIFCSVTHPCVYEKKQYNGVSPNWVETLTPYHHKHLPGPRKFKRGISSSSIN